MFSVGKSIIPPLQKQAAPYIRGRYFSLCNCPPDDCLQNIGKRIDETCRRAVQGNDEPCRRGVQGNGTDEEEFGAALKLKNRLNPLYPYQQGLLKPNSMLHPNHPFHDLSSPDTPSPQTPMSHKANNDLIASESVDHVHDTSSSIIDSVGDSFSGED